MSNKRLICIIASVFVAGCNTDGLTQPGAEGADMLTMSNSDFIPTPEPWPKCSHGFTFVNRVEVTKGNFFNFNVASSQNRFMVGWREGSHPSLALIGMYYPEGDIIPPLHRVLEGNSLDLMSMRATSEGFIANLMRSDDQNISSSVVRRIDQNGNILGTPLISSRMAYETGLDTLDGNLIAAGDLNSPMLTLRVDRLRDDGTWDLFKSMQTSRNVTAVNVPAMAYDDDTGTVALAVSYQDVSNVFHFSLFLFNKTSAREVPIMSYVHPTPNRGVEIFAWRVMKVATGYAVYWADDRMNSTFGSRNLTYIRADDSLGPTYPLSDTFDLALLGGQLVAIKFRMMPKYDVGIATLDANGQEKSYLSFAPNNNSNPRLAVSGDRAMVVWGEGYTSQDHTLYAGIFACK